MGKMSLIDLILNGVETMIYLSFIGMIIMIASHCLFYQILHNVDLGIGDEWESLVPLAAALSPLLCVVPLGTAFALLKLTKKLAPDSRAAENN
jgi:hypothetical protein